MLNYFSEVYENIIKCRLVDSMYNKYLAIYFSLQEKL